jgi:hypothetical protein
METEMGYSYYDALRNFGAPKKHSFSKTLGNGTTIFGDKRVEGRPGFQHGHKGSNFHRSPYSALGSAATGRSRTYQQHKKNTSRW